MADDLPLPQTYIDAIKGFEGFTPKAQWDVNNFRNGYGTNARYPGEAIDQATATDRLHSELGKAAGMVDAKFPNLPDSHRAALTSLTFNAGPGWMNQGLGAAVGSGDWDTAKRLFTGYNHSAGQVNPGLTNRRNSEASWLSGAVPGPGAMPAGAQRVIAGLDPSVANVSPEGIGEPRAAPGGAVVSTAPATMAGAGATIDAAQKALNAEKQAEGDKQSKQLMALAQQLMTASAAPKANFMQLTPGNTGPLRPLPLDLPKFGQLPTQS